MNKVIFKSAAVRLKSKAAVNKNRILFFQICLIIITCIMIVINALFNLGWLLLLSFLSVLICFKLADNTAQIAQSRLDYDIIAYDDHLAIDEVDIGSEEIKCRYDINYAEIYKSFFTDRACTKLVIILLNGENLKLKIRNLSATQYYFLYVAPEYINLTSPKQWRIIKRFGNEKKFQERMNCNERGD